MIKNRTDLIRKTPYTRLLELHIWSPLRKRDVVVKTQLENAAHQAEHLSKLDPKSVVKIMQNNVCRVKFVNGEIVNIVRMEYCTNEKSIDIPYRGSLL